MYHEFKDLIEKAIEAQNFAYAPYSKLKVGASVLTKSGKIYTGANIENASYPAGICAERVALSKAISEGEKDFFAICITSNNIDYTYPCGICRQFLSEFNDDIKIVIAKDQTDYRLYSLEDLLPHSFK